MKWTHLLFLIAPVLMDCRPKDCYEIKVQFEKNANLEKNCPLVTDGGIVGYVTDVDKKKEGLSTAKICIPRDVKIPRDSKFFAGYVKEFSSPCIKIDFGALDEFDNGEHPLTSIYQDTIRLVFPDVDTTLSKKITDMVKEHNLKKKVKK